MSYFPPYTSYYQAWNSDPQKNLNYYPYMYYVNHFNESFFSPAPFSQPQQNREFGSAQKIKLEARINHEDNISTVKVENKQEKSPELRVNSQSSMKKEKRQPIKEQKKTKVRFSKQVLTKSFNDDDFKLNQRKKEESHCQKEGRNRNSNLFRAFIKLLLTKTYHQNLFETFSNIANSNNIKLSFENFISLLQKKAPAFTNYINNKEFRNLYNGEQEFNQVFRIMFKKFLKQEGITHILTISYKDRMKRDSISQFLDSLHGVQFDRKPKKPTRF